MPECGGMCVSVWGGMPDTVLIPTDGCQKKTQDQVDLLSSGLGLLHRGPVLGLPFQKLS